MGTIHNSDSAIDMLVMVTILLQQLRISKTFNNTD